MREKGGAKFERQGRTHVLKSQGKPSVKVELLNFDKSRGAWALIGAATHFVGRCREKESIIVKTNTSLIADYTRRVAILYLIIFFGVNLSHATPIRRTIHSAAALVYVRYIIQIV